MPNVVPSRVPSGAALRARLLAVVALVALTLLATATNALARPFGGTGRSLEVSVPIVASQDTFDFGTGFPVGTGASFQQFTITNTTTEPVTMSGFDAPTGFVFFDVNGLGSTLEPGEVREFEVGFDPPSPGDYDATATLSTSAGNVTLRLIGNAVPGGSIDLSPSSWDFGDLNVDEFGQLQITVSNSGNAPVTVNPPFLQDGSITLTSTLLSPISLGPGEAQQVVLNVGPLQEGPASDVILFANDDQTVVTAFDATLNGVRANLTFDPASLDFGSVEVGQSRTVDVQISNSGTGTAVPTDLDIHDGTAADFSAAVPDPIAPGETVTMPVTFTPSAGGTRTATLSLGTQGGGGGITIPLSGEGQVPASSDFTFTASAAPTGATPATEVAAGDFNGDGKVDLAVGYRSTGDVAWARGNGDGTFGALATLESRGASAEMGLSAGDANGDGFDELAIASAGGVTVYRGGAAGLVLLGRPLTSAATDVRLADLDEDGLLDLAVLDTPSHRLRLFRGTGTAFTAAGSIAFTNEPREFDLGDLDAQANVDIVVGSTSSSGTPRLQLLRRSQYGPLDASQWGGPPIDVDVPTTPVAVALGQLNDDGTLDITTGDAVVPSGKRDTAPGSGNGFYPNLPGDPVSTGAGGEAIAIADFDGDGRDDQALATSSAASITVQRGLGGARFGGASSFPVGASTATAPADVVTADVNGDGRPDVLAARGGTGIDVLLNGRAQAAPAPGAGRALIGEFRAGEGALVQVANPSRSQRLRLGGWQLRFPGGQRYAFPAWVQLGPGASMMVGTLTSPFGDPAGLFGQPVTRIGVPNGVQGAALHDPSGARVDAVGLASVPAAFREGAGLPARDLGMASTYARLERAGALVDTGDNAADTQVLNPMAADGDGTVLGQPGFRFAYDPTDRNDILQSSLLDPTKASSAAPNRERVGDTLWIRRRVTNCSGGLTTGVCVNADPSAPAVAVTRLRFRTTDLTTVGNSSGAIVTFVGAENPAGGPRYSFDGLTNLFMAFLYGDRGAGINGAIDVTDRLPAAGLLPGQSIDIAFKLKVLRGGAFRFGYTADDDLVPVAGSGPAPAPAVTATPAPTLAPSDASSGPGAASVPPASAAVPDAAAGSLAPPVRPVAAQQAIVTKPKPKCLTKSQIRKLKPKQRKKARLCKAKLPASKVRR